MADPIPDQPINHTPFTPLGTDPKDKPTNPPEILKNLMVHYNKQLAIWGDYGNIDDDTLKNDTFRHEVIGRKKAIAFIKSEKAYLQTQIDELLSKQ